MHTCLNCGLAIESTATFCSNCGQKTSTHRLAMHDIWHDVLHAFTHTDKGVLFLLKALITNPGMVIKEYIQGKRKKYFSPFTSLLIIVGISTFMMNVSGFFIENPSYTKMPANPISNFVNKHVNLIILLNVPLLALFNSLFFRKQYNYAENLIVGTYTSAIRSIYFTLLIAPLWMLVHQFYYVILFTYLVGWLLFYAWVCTKVFSGKKWLVFLKGILVTLCTQLATVFFITIAFTIYFKFFYHK